MIQIHSGRKDLARRISKVTFMGISVFASWAFAMSAVWGVGPFSWPKDAPEPSIVAENITVDTVTAKDEASAATIVSAASVSR